jgi:hypothetical protein
MKRNFGASLWLFAFCGSADIMDEGSTAVKALYGELSCKREGP